LGELTQVVPFELVDAVLADTATTQQRLRDLPSRVGIYLLLAMGLFEQAGLWGSKNPEPLCVIPEWTGPVKSLVLVL
jgi:hypothetical protein